MKAENWKNLHKGYLDPVTLGETAENVLQKFINIGVTASALADDLRRNQVYRRALDIYIEAQIRKSAAETEFSAANSLHNNILKLGLLGVRNFVVALRLERKFEKEWRFGPSYENDKFDFNKNLFFALKTQEFCKTNKIHYAESASFSAGLLYDCMLRMALDKNPDNKEAGKYITDLWKRSMQMAHLSLALSQRASSFQYHKFAFAAGLVMDIGKFLQYLVIEQGGKNHDWSDFEKDNEKIDSLMKREVTFIREKKKFVYTHSDLGALLLEYFTILQPLAPAIKYHHTPYFLTNNKGLYQLASCLHLTASIVGYEKPLDPTKAPLKEWKKQKWYKDLGISDADLLETVKQYGKISVS